MNKTLATLTAGAIIIGAVPVAAVVVAIADGHTIGYDYAIPRPHAISEDSAEWDCATDGNRICGPTNSNGLPAGCYNDIGAMVAPWPCHVVVGADGNADVFIG